MVAGDPLVGEEGEVFAELDLTLGEHRVVDRFFGGEVRVEAGRTHPDARRQLAQRQPGEAALSTQLPGRGEDLAARLRTAPIDRPVTSLRSFS